MFTMNDFVVLGRAIKVDRTALQMAAEEGHTAIVRMLIDRSADVNARDMLKMTALHWYMRRSASLEHHRRSGGLG